MDYGTTTRLNEVDTYFQYNGLGQQTRVSVPSAESSASDANDANIWWRRSADWSVGYSETTYDPLGRVLKTIAPNGEETQSTYTGRESYTIGIGRNGDPNKVLQWQIVDALGNLKYVRSGAISGSTLSISNTIQLTHTATGNLTSVYNSVSTASTTMTYDGAGRKTQMIDSDLGTWSYAYDQQGALTRQTDARGWSTCLYYEDALGRLAGKFFQQNNTTCPASPTYAVSYLYDQSHSASNRSRGQLTKIDYTDNRWDKTITYNGKGMPQQETVSITTTSTSSTVNSYSTSYTYDTYLRPSTVTYPGSEVLTHAYNSMGLPLSLNSNSSNGMLIDSAVYSVTGQLLSLRMPVGTDLYRTQTYWPWKDAAKNNSNARLSEIKVGTTPGGSDRLYLLHGYDSNGNVGGRLEKYNNGAAEHFSYCYDLQNRLSRAHAPYDATKTCTVNASNTYTTGLVYSYDSAGRMTSYEGTAQSYDSQHKHAVEWAKINSGTAVNRNLYVVAKVSLGCTGTNGGAAQMNLYINGSIQTTTTVSSTSWQTYTFSLPLKGRDQIDVAFANNCGDATGDRNLYIDYVTVGTASGNKTIQAENTIIDRATGNNSTLFDGNDILEGGQGMFWTSAMRFVVAPDATSIAYGYDLNGNISYKLRDGVAETFTYDAENHLTQFKRVGTGAMQENYIYDADGNRVKKSVGSAHTYYPFAHYEVDNGTVVKYYFFGGQRIAMLRGTTFTYLHTDHLGSTVLETVNGAMTADQKYFAYGKQRDTGTVVTDHRFTGQKSDGSGLMYYNARYYDPSIGTFISPDTIVPSPGIVADYNRYAYVRGRVLNATDPSGHFTDDDIAYLCPGCKTWDDVWAFFKINNDKAAQRFFKHSSTTFGSLVFTGSGGEYALILYGSADPSSSLGDFSYTFAVWDTVNDNQVDVSTILGSSQFAVWYTSDLNVNTPYEIGFTKGWDSSSAVDFKDPPAIGVNNFRDLHNVISPKYPEIYRVHRNVCGLCIADTLWSATTSTIDAIEKSADGIGLTIDIVDVTTNPGNPWLDARYPVVQNGYERHWQSGHNNLGRPAPRE